VLVTFKLEQLPLSVPIGKMAYFIPLNKVQAVRLKKGDFHTIDNERGKYPKIWPDPLMNPNTFSTIKCTLLNHGKTNLKDVEAPLTTF